MTLLQAISYARTITVYATDVLSLDVTKKQARQIIEQHDFKDAQTHSGENVPTWDILLKSRALSLRIPVKGNGQ